jgi:glycosyltransferase involved in cell wall biosynthesis
VGNWKRLDEYALSAEESRAVRLRLGIPEGALVVACITQLLKDRKIEELLEAAEGLPGVYVVVGGKGILEPLVKEWEAKNPRVRFVGFVRGKEIPAYTCAADIVYYGFAPANPNARFSAPNKLFEALAAGRPLITGDFGEIAEVVREAGCGIVLPEYSPQTVRSALERLRDGTVRHEMAARARDYGRGFLNWERAEEVLYREYSALLPAALHLPARDAVGEVAPHAGSGA